MLMKYINWEIYIYVWRKEFDYALFNIVFWYRFFKNLGFECLENIVEIIFFEKC